MKFRSDFITNSSSTSFIISLKGNFTFKNFCKALKVTENFPLLFFIKDMFRTIHDKIKLLPYDIDKNGKIIIDEDIDLYLDDPRRVKNLTLLKSKKRKVYYGEFWDQDDTNMSYYLCFAKILVENEDIYFDSIDEYY